MKKVSYAVFFLFIVSPFLAFAETMQVGNTGVQIRSAVDVSLPQLGEYYGDKLQAVKDSIVRATEAQKKKQEAACKDLKGAEQLSCRATFDGPLYLLRKMGKNLETDYLGQLKDSQGLSKFFAHLKALRQYTSSDFSAVIQSARNFTGFSYLFPHAHTSSDKPLLIFIPPTGEPAGWADILSKEAANSNVVGYVYDNTLSKSEMVDALLAGLKKSGLHERDSVMVAYSFGNTVMLHAAEQAVSSGDNTFSRTSFVSLGFLPGGASDFLGFLGKIPFLSTVGRFIYPAGAGVLEVLPPDSSPQGPQARLVNNLGKIDQSTLGISYVQSKPEGEYHIKRNSPHPFYGPTVNQFFNEMESNGKVTYVPENHWNLPGASAVKALIDKKLTTITPHKPKSSVNIFMTMRSVFAHLFGVRSSPGTLATIGVASPAVAAPSVLQIISSLFGGTLNECETLTDALAEGALRIPGTDYTQTTRAVKEYLAETPLPCSFDVLEKTANTFLSNEAELPSQTPSLGLNDLTDDSIFDTVSVDLKVNGQDGPIEVEKRDRIVLSWISEGATRCRGVWSKNDIKLSGTASGRITRPVTIKIACINADGERADDEVRVNVTD